MPWGLNRVGKGVEDRYGWLPELSLQTGQGSRRWGCRQERANSETDRAVCAGKGVIGCWDDGFANGP